MYRFVCFRTECREPFTTPVYSNRSYCSDECRQIVEGISKKPQVLMMRHRGLMISEISSRLGISITEVCKILFEQHFKDMENDD